MKKKKSEFEKYCDHRDKCRRCAKGLIEEKCLTGAKLFERAVYLLGR